MLQLAGALELHLKTRLPSRAGSAQVAEQPGLAVVKILKRILERGLF